MRGICGFIRLDNKPADEHVVEGMADALLRTPIQHTTTWCEGAAAFGAAAWSMSAPVDARPCLAIHAGTGTVVIADARLASRAALLATLGPQDEATDAQVILDAWLRWGEEAPQHLDGDFTFVVWEPRSQRATCVRDRMGVKPLYFHHRPERLLAFASSDKALLAMPEVPGEINEARIADFLVSQLEGVDKTSTFHTAIERLPPAHIDRFEAATHVRSRYWTLVPDRDPSRYPTTDAGWAEALRAVLEEAVADHLAGSDRVGCMLSGGLDSSSLAVIARNQLLARGAAPLPTFSSVDRANPECPETRAIDAMLASEGYAPTLIDAAAIDAIAAQLAAAAWASDEPFDAEMTLLRAQYLRAGRAGVEALMDGIDGDVLFGEGSGLTRSIRAGRLREAWRNAQGMEAVYGRAAIAWRTSAVALRTAAIPPQVRRALQHSLGKRRMHRNIASSVIAPDFARRVNLGARLKTLANLRSPHLVLDPGREMAESLDHPYTPSALERYHRVAAEYGVSPRHPLLDRRVLEFCVNLPDRQRLGEGWTKHVLRNAMADALPAAVARRQGKAHLGWAVTTRAVLNDPAELVQRLARYRGLLTPYIDLNKLDRALSKWQRIDYAPRTPREILDSVAMGAWLDGER